jgi:hypothetical protein
MLYTVPNFRFNFNLDEITRLKFLDGFETVEATHDTTVAPRNFNTNKGSLILEAKFDVLASVPIIHGSDDPGVHFIFIG